MKIQYQKAFSLILSTVFVFGTALPALATSSQSTTGQQNRNVITEASKVCLETARKAYTAAIKKADDNFKISRDANRAILETSLHEAQGDKVKTAVAQNTYKEAMKVVRNNMITAKAAALVTFKAANIECVPCRTVARITYTTAIHNADTNFKTARDAARDSLKTTLQEVQGNAAKQEIAQNTYKEGIKAAQTTMTIAKDTALVAFKAAREVCKVAK